MNETYCAVTRGTIYSFTKLQQLTEACVKLPILDKHLNVTLLVIPCHAFDQIIADSDPSVFTLKHRSTNFENDSTSNPTPSNHTSQTDNFEIVNCESVTNNFAVNNSVPLCAEISTLCTDTVKCDGALGRTDTNKPGKLHGGRIPKVLKKTNINKLNQSCIDSTRTGKKSAGCTDNLPEGEANLHCEICGKPFRNQQQYRGHLRVHSKDLVWMCEKCPDLRFSTKAHLSQHLKEHTGLRRDYVCSVCSMAFYEVKRLNSHIRFVHSIDRPYKCDECDKAFKKRYDLRCHQNTHKGKQPACHVCGKKFADTSNLNRHVLLHTEEKPYICDTCGKRYQQLAGLKRHQEDPNKSESPCWREKATTGQYHCKICGEKFQYKSGLVEHTVRAHTDTIVDPKTTQTSDLGRNVDALIEMLFKETDQKTYNGSINETSCVESYKEPTDLDNVETHVNLTQVDGENTADNLFDIELINEIDKIQGLADQSSVTTVENQHRTEEYQMQTDFFNSHVDTSMNFDNFHANQSFNLQHSDLNMESMPIAKDLLYELATTSGEKNNFIEILSDELLTVNKSPTLEMPKENFENLDQTVSVNDCSTIFESDIDLEASTNLAANLNQLIGENNVQFISTEDDDTFIISLNSTIDAEQLTDLLNIGIEIVDPNEAKYNLDEDAVGDGNEVDDFIADIKRMQNKNINRQEVEKEPTLYSCGTCRKIFKKKYNYYSHLGTHNPKLSRYKCAVCKKKFSYQSTLNKHTAASHSPLVWKNYPCDLCKKQYRSAWMLKYHKQRDHLKLTPYKCQLPGCGKAFYKRADFIYHHRLHRRERPYVCAKCGHAFTHPSHLARHSKKVDCNRRKTNEMSKELLSDIDELLKSKII